MLAFLQLFSGRALTQFSLFALGIMPYITASIIMQILTVVIPKLQDWQQEGATGQRKITQWTRYLTIGIAVLQSTGLVFLFHNGGGGLVGGSNNLDLVPNFTPLRVSLIVLTFTAGTALLTARQLVEAVLGHHVGECTQAGCSYCPAWEACPKRAASP